MKSSFRNTLPRVYDLTDTLAAPSHPDAFLLSFENDLEIPIVLDNFRKLERWLGLLDEVAWQNLKQSAAPRLVSKQREVGRGWEALFDILNEARAFGYLQSIGCTGIHFIECKDNGRTPDLGALQDGRDVFCEVKTINPSDDEATRRNRMQSGAVVSDRPQVNVGEGFLTKLRATFANALKQLDAVDPERRARRIIFIMISFDDFWGDYLDRYIAQIDANLLRQPLEGAELVMCLSRRDLCERSFTMKSATILPE